MKSYGVINLTRSKLFRLYFIEKNNCKVLMERYLRELISNFTNAKLPPPPFINS